MYFHMKLWGENIFDLPPSTMYIGYKTNFTQETKELNSHLHKCVDKPDHNCYAAFVLSFTPTWFIYVTVQ